jgi:hypothetical protein
VASDAVLRDHHHVTDSVRSDPRRVRAARRASLPTVRARRPAPGRHHPASASDVRAALEAFGNSAYYGVKLIELVPTRATRDGLMLGSFVGPGQIELYDQPRPPWRLGDSLTAPDRARLASAGAHVGEDGVIDWPGDTLRRFMIAHVLTHELGHHILQHERRLRGARGARTRDHEARAEEIADGLRDRLTWS